MPKKSNMPRNKISPQKVSKPPELKNDSESGAKVEGPKTESGLDPEAEDKFQLELYWCIQELESAFSKLNDNKEREESQKEKQVYNITKSLNVLKSKTAPLIKKRQVMRNTFGDYRAKMAEEEKKMRKQVTNVKFVTSDASVQKAEKSCIYLRKAKCICLKKDLLNPDKPEKTIIDLTPSTEPFKFNFNIDKTCDG